MSYTPHTWRSAELVTAAKLNAIEQGVAEVASSYTPHTWQNNEQITAEKMNNIEQAIASVGGGGSSDFSTAEVTINAPSGVVILCAVYDTGNYAFIGAVYNVTDVPDYVVPLYKGEGDITFITGPENYNISVTGSIEYVSAEGYFTVTGNGTITITAI